jgi:hypothetical protein
MISAPLKWWGSSIFSSKVYLVFRHVFGDFGIQQLCFRMDLFFFGRNVRLWKLKKWKNKKKMDMEKMKCNVIIVIMVLRTLVQSSIM